MRFVPAGTKALDSSSMSPSCSPRAPARLRRREECALGIAARKAPGGDGLAARLAAPCGVSSLWLGGLKGDETKELSEGYAVVF